MWWQQRYKILQCLLHSQLMDADVRMLCCLFSYLGLVADMDADLDINMDPWQMGKCPVECYMTSSQLFSFPQVKLPSAAYLPRHLAAVHQVKLPLSKVRNHLWCCVDDRLGSKYTQYYTCKQILKKSSSTNTELCLVLKLKSKYLPMYLSTSTFQ